VKLEKGELILLLLEAGVSLSSASERTEVFDMLPQAREAALRAGIAEDLLGEPDKYRCPFWSLVHLLRAIFHKDDKGAVLREDAAIEETQFEVTEVRQFREIFLECSRWGTEGDAEPTPAANKEELQPAVQNRGRRASTPAAAAQPPPMVTAALAAEMAGKHFEERLPKKTLQETLRGNPAVVLAPLVGIRHVLLSRRLGIKLSVVQQKDFEQRVALITDRSDSLVDFADFLRVMRWLLSANFANINGVANQIASHDDEIDPKASDQPKAHVSAQNVSTRRKSI
jgi:hypothetical protein